MDATTNSPIHPFTVASKSDVPPDSFLRTHTRNRKLNAPPQNQKITHIWMKINLQGSCLVLLLFDRQKVVFAIAGQQQVPLVSA